MSEADYPTQLPTSDGLSPNRRVGTHSFQSESLHHFHGDLCEKLLSSTELFPFRNEDQSAAPSPFIVSTTQFSD